MSSQFLIGRRPYAVAPPAAPVPVAGGELLTNGNFSAWTGDNPNSWTVNGTETASVYIRESTGRAEMTTDGTLFNITQTVLFAGLWYAAGIEVISVTGSIGFLIGATNPLATIFTPGILLATSRATEVNFQIKRLGGAATAVFDNATCKLLPLSSLISARLYAHADIDISAAVTRTSGTQAGFAVRVDSPTNPQNFIISYLDGAGNLKTDKCVAGAYTNIAGCSGAVTYGAGKIPRIVCSGTSVSVYYDGTQVGTTQTVSDAGIISNKYHGLFSTYASNTFASVAASSWVAVTP